MHPSLVRRKILRLTRLAPPLCMHIIPTSAVRSYLSAAI